jgi:hypothetical protein
MAAPGVPRKPHPTISRVQHLFNNNRMKNAESLRKTGRNVAEMFEPNEHVEVFDFSPIEEHMIRTNYERPNLNRRTGMVTPSRQIKNTSALGLPPKVPSAPVKKRKTRRHRANGRTRKN